MPNPETFVDPNGGNPLFCIKLKDGKLFRFGVGKACLILKHIGKLRDFVDRHSRPKQRQ